jgi:peptidoglycan/LPS O-acetylase OafA/YrhL
MSDVKYRPEIDGLRAIAVLAVVFFHAGLGLRGGYVGVDVFFVISGYLITGIIQNNLDNDRFSLFTFWERRIRRIFPALAISVLATLLVGYLLLLPQELEALGNSSIAQALFVANIYFWTETGYFAGPAEQKPLLHTWSLAVEEQFYFIYPFFLQFLKLQSAVSRFYIVAVTTFASFGLSVYGSYFFPSATFFLLPTRAWELSAGAMIALSPWALSRRRYFNEALSIIGIIMIVAATLWFDERTRFPGVAALLPVLGTVALLYGTAGTRDTTIGKLLSVRPFVFVGLLSYSIYLWHWPAIVFVRIGFGYFGPKQVVLALAITSVCSLLSWWLVEGTTRKKTVLRTRKSLIAGSMIVLVLMIGTSATFVLTGGLPNRFPSNLAALIEDSEWIGAERLIFGKDFSLKDLKEMGVSTGPNNARGLDLFVWGDSHAAILFDALSELAEKHELSAVACVSAGQIPIPGVALVEEDGGTVEEQLRAREMIFDYLEREKPKNLLLVARWSLYVEGFSEVEFASNPSLLTDTHLLTSAQGDLEASKESNMLLIEKNLRRTADFCEANGIRLWILKQVPETGENSPASSLVSHVRGLHAALANRVKDKSQHAKRQAGIESIFDSLSSKNIRFVDLQSVLFDRDGKTINYKDGRAIYRDNDHLTKWGVEQTMPLLDVMISEMETSPTK